ncbi:MAG: capsid cement protein [Amphritea sp.]
MKNYIQDGKNLEHVAAADCVSGDVLVMGQLVGVAVDDIKTGETGIVTLCGVFELPKKAATAFTQGQRLFWDGAEVTDVATANDFMGWAAAVAASADATAAVLLGAADQAGV